MKGKANKNDDVKEEWGIASVPVPGEDRSICSAQDGQKSKNHYQESLSLNRIKNRQWG